MQAALLHAWSCNPVQWANAMAAQGSGGAYEISQRMTAMIGWGGTANFKEDWAYDQVHAHWVAQILSMHLQQEVGAANHERCTLR